MWLESDQWFLTSSAHMSREPGRGLPDSGRATRDLALTATTGVNAGRSLPLPALHSSPITRACEALLSQGGHWQPGCCHGCGESHTWTQLSGRGHTPGVRGARKAFVLGATGWLVQPTLPGGFPRAQQLIYGLPCWFASSVKNPVTSRLLSSRCNRNWSLEQWTHLVEVTKLAGTTGVMTPGADLPCSKREAAKSQLLNRLGHVCCKSPQREEKAGADDYFHSESFRLWEIN